MTRKFIPLICILSAFFLTGAAFQFGGIRHDLTSNLTSVSPVILNNSSLQVQRFTGSTAQVIKLPDATTLRNGMWYTFINESSAALTISDTSSTPITTISAASQTSPLSKTMYLTSSSTTGGPWSIDPGGATGGAAGGGLTCEEFTADDTFTVGSGTNTILIWAIGGGGGGGSTPNTGTTGGASGGCSGTFEHHEIAATPSATYDVDVGAAGAGATSASSNGTAGSSSRVLLSSTVLFSAAGGSGGTGTSGSTGGAACSAPNIFSASSGAGGDGLANNGQPGSNGSTSINPLYQKGTGGVGGTNPSLYTPGGGGGGAAGVGGAGGDGGDVQAGSPGNGGNATGYGGGGGGGAKQGNADGYGSGGNGSAGYIRVCYN